MTSKPLGSFRGMGLRLTRGYCKSGRQQRGSTRTFARRIDWRVYLFRSNALFSEMEYLTSRYPNSLRAWWAVAVFCFAGVVSYTDRLILSALVDPIRRSLEVSDSAVSLLQGAAFALVYVFSGLLLGRLADQRRRLSILIAGSLLWCVGTVACGLAGSFWALFLSRVAVGLGEAALLPAAVSIIADLFPPTRRGFAIGVFMLGFVVGGPLSITIGSVLLSLANQGLLDGVPIIGSLEPWRAVLVGVGIGGLAAPALFLTLREPVRQDSMPVLPLRAMLKRLSRDRQSLLPLYLAIGVLAIGDYGTLAWVPSLLSRRFDLAQAQLGAAFGVVTGIAGILGCLLGGLGSDLAARACGSRGRLLFCTGAAAFAAIGAALISSPQISVVLMGLGMWTLSSASAAIAGVAAIQNCVPAEYRGVGMALLTFCTTLLGLGCGPTVVALITDHVFGNPASVGFSIAVTAVPAGVIALVLFLLASRHAESRPVQRFAEG